MSLPTTEKFIENHALVKSSVFHYNFFLSYLLIAEILITYFDI